VHARAAARGGAALELTFVVGPAENQIDVAPASAWLGRIADRAQKSKFIMDCIDCHAVPAPEVRHYAGAIADVHATDAALARSQSWGMIVKYMNYLSSWEFSRGRRDDGEQIDADAVYSVENGQDVVALMTDVFDDRLDSISGYDWGAPRGALVLRQRSDRELLRAAPRDGRDGHGSRRPRGPGHLQVVRHHALHGPGRALVPAGRARQRPAIRQGIRLEQA